MEFSGLTNEGPDYGRRAASAAVLPSGDALDRATNLVARYQSLAHGGLVEEVAKLIVAADKEQIGGHGVVHWHRTAERRMSQIVELEGVVRRRNASVAELESELDGLRKNGGANLLKAIDRANAAESALSQAYERVAHLERELSTVEPKLAIADRQRREFKGHADTANARRVEVERELDRLRGELHRTAQQGGAEIDALRAQIEQGRTSLLAITPTDTLLEELRRRLNP